MASRPGPRRRPRGSALVLTLLLLLLVATGGGVAAQSAGLAAAPPPGAGSDRAAANQGAQNPAPPPPPGTICQPGSKTIANCAPGQTAPRPGAGAAAGPPPASSGGAVSATATAKTLILYDYTLQYGFLGELYATGAANLASHFGTWTAKPIASYAAGEINSFDAIIYIGSTYGEPLPPAFLDDVLATQSKKVVWINANIWQLADRDLTRFQTLYGWDARAGASTYDTTVNTSANPTAGINKVQYKGTDLTRDGSNGSGLYNPTIVTPALVTTLATAVRGNNTTLPWAIRSGNLTYIGEIPFAYTKEEDRSLAFADMLHDVLAPGTPTQRRALLRLEDLNAASDPAQLTRIVDYLSSQNVPFGFGLSPLYSNPANPNDIPLTSRPALVTAIRYAISKGGTIIQHGYTHQWSGGINPYNGTTGNDFEFFRVTENTDRTLKFVGPLPGDSAAWAQSRIDGSQQANVAAGLPKAKIFEFPHYTGSALDYGVANSNFTTRWERTVYFNGVLSGTPVSYPQNFPIFGQMFPYAVRDVYGTVVLPENLGSIELNAFYQFPIRLPADLINAANKNLVVRDGFAAFYYHPDFADDRIADPNDPNYLKNLKETVVGIKNLGYTFVSAADVSAGAAQAVQTINFNTPAGTPSYTVGKTFTVGATASSGLAVTFAIAGPCTIVGTTVTTTGAGTCSVTATQAGNAAYAPASTSRSFTITSPGTSPAPSPGTSPAPSPGTSPAPSPGTSPAPSSSFADVPTAYWAYQQITQFAQRGITTGCGGDDQGRRLYCPERGVTRAEMAVFLTRTLGQDKIAPPTTPTFADVPTNYWAYGQIEAFAKLEITTGCGTDERGRRLYCPDRGVTRAEMAAFLDRAKGQGELKSATPTFADVPASYWAYGWIERFYTLGITTGCGTDTKGNKLYCPDRGVTRAEMAVFVIRAYP